MKSKAFDNPHSAGTDELTLNKDDFQTSEKFGNGLKSGLAYGVWAVGDAFYNSDLYGLGFDPVSAAVFRTALIGAPTVAVVLCKGWKAYVPAAFLTLLAIFGGVGHFIGASMGDASAGYGYGVAHLLFAAAFARTGWNLFKRRK
ncbi:MAG: hypothetical protein AAFX54_17835 [Pseudomonadota bacterium]